MLTVHRVSNLIYILESDFFEKDVNTYLKLEISVLYREFLAFNVFIVSLKQSR